MHVHIRISVRVLGLLHHAPPLKKKHVDKFRCVGEGSADCGAYVSDDIFGKDVDHVLGSRDNSMLDDENGMHPTVRKTLFWCCRCIRKNCGKAKKHCDVAVDAFRLSAFMGQSSAASGYWVRLRPICQAFMLIFYCVSSRHLHLQSAQSLCWPWQMARQQILTHTTIRT